MGRKKIEIVKGFKATDKDLKCRNFQYKIGKEYKEDKAELCNSGFHFCENPLDILNYYDLCDCRMFEVEAKEVSDEKQDKDTKRVSKRIKLTAELGLAKFINISFNYLKEQCKLNDSNEKILNDSGNYSQVATSGNYSQVATSGDSSQVATSGYSSKVATSGNYSQVATSGNYSQVATSGNYSQVATSGYSSKVATSGYSSKVATSGDSSQVATSGYSSKVATSGYSSKVATSGDSSQVATSGNYSQVATSGDSSQVATSGYSSKVATSGNYSQVATSGNYSQVATSGDSSQVATSGDSSQVAIDGEYSVGMCAGYGCEIKGKKGNWITLAEWGFDSNLERYIPICVKSAQIDGKIIKEDTYYKLENGEFVEC